MGTPLTSATVASTYQALLKTSNNAALSPSSGAIVSDGLGNDTPLIIGRGFVSGMGNASGVPDNTAFGIAALSANTSGNSCVAIGANAMENDNGTFENIAIGARAMQNSTIGASKCIAIGTDSGSALSNANNIIIGHNSLKANTSGMIAIGNDCTTTVSGSGLAIGHGAAITSNGQIAIGSVTTPLGTVTTETVSSTRTWTVTINGVARKILLA